MAAAYDRAVLHFGQRRFVHARGELAQELASNPENAQAFALWALCLCEAERKNLPDARRKAEHAIALNPAEPFAHYALSWVCYHGKFFFSAEKAIREALRLKPRDPEYLSLLADILYRLSRLPAAIEAAREGLAIDAGHAASHRVLALALRKAGDSEAAKAHAA